MKRFLQKFLVLSVAMAAICGALLVHSSPAHAAGAAQYTVYDYLNSCYFTIRLEHGDDGSFSALNYTNLGRSDDCETAANGSAIAISGVECISSVDGLTYVSPSSQGPYNPTVAYLTPSSWTQCQARFRTTGTLGQTTSGDEYIIAWDSTNGFNSPNYGNCAFTNNPFYVAAYADDSNPVSGQENPQATSFFNC